MNALFVSIKVDREERPDLDQIYQLVVQIMGRSGGWPLTVFLTPEQKPFFAGTYFPPHDKYGRPGFPKVLDAIAEAYRTRKEEIADPVRRNRERAIFKTCRRTNVFEKRCDAITPDFLGECSEKIGHALRRRARRLRIGATKIPEHHGARRFVAIRRRYRQIKKAISNRWRAW